MSPAARPHRSRPGPRHAQQTRRGALTGQLLRAWRRTLAAEDWRQLDPAQLRRAGADLLELAYRRRPRQALVRVCSQREARAPGAPAPRTLIELVTDELPLLTDTVSMILAQSGLTAQLIIAPVLRVRRDRAGRLRALDDARRRAQPPSGLAVGRLREYRESWHYVCLERLLAPQECTALHRRLSAALQDLRDAARDQQAMRRAVLRLCEQLDRSPPPLAPAVLSESRALLQYLTEDHFTFLGYLESRLRRARRGPQLLPVPRSALGLLRARRGRTAEGRVSGTDIRRARRSPELLVITKANRRSTVQRPGYLDYIGVKRFDRRGRPCGEARIVGLWTDSAYRADVRTVPWLRLKLERVMSQFPFAPHGHDAERLVRVLEKLPRDELLQASVTELTAWARAWLRLQQQPRPRLLMRQDPFRRFWSCLVLLPRERCDSTARARIEALLRRAFGASELDSIVTVGEDPLAQLHVVLRVDAARTRRPAAARLEQQLTATVVSWLDRLRAALHGRFDSVRALGLERRYAPALPPAYRQDVTAQQAIEDMLELERLADAPDEPRLRLEAADGATGAARLHLRMVRAREPLPVSEVLPTFEHFGLRVIAERPYRLQLEPQPAWIQDFELETRSTRALDVGRVGAQLSAAFSAVRAAQLDDDGFNALLIVAALTARQVEVLRACCRYLLQICMPFSQSYMERVLVAHASIARALWQLFELRMSPARGHPRRARAVEHRIRRALEAVASPNEDRILRALLSVILATVRTNYFQRDRLQPPRSWLTLKIDPRRIAAAPRPRPACEMFVHGPRLEAVHLRMGPVARGGIRWSERPEDFRTEILGLMKAQRVKNSLIVPVGAKGGFIARRLAPGAPREVQQREVTACYREFMHALLDLTDNIVGDHVVPARDLVRLDGDDPYLVVAADKGTASFSDLANAIAAERRYWLGDAFASGGSHGYDHKQMGITARGAWVCAERHFRELGIDTRSGPVSVAAIGDMSGDVFGNGMLRSRGLRLLAAFDHRHVFIDPSPDPLASWRERARLFRLPRSSWSDYDARVISRGGGVYPRQAKSVLLSPEAQRLLGLPQRRASGVELVRAILCLSVDLLWNGGIGTYVKATGETHAEIGDRSNDAVRVDGRQLRARVVAEGGNLGFSQLGRIEYAAHGGRINADFIDNSAGVNTSDIEVNLKILLDAPLRGARISSPRRDRLLRAARTQVLELVLRNNYLQSQAISLMERRAVTALAEHQQLLRWLERRGELDRALEFLPDDAELEERRRQGRGLTRPELALLMCYGKIALKHALARGAPQLGGTRADPALARELAGYFPAALRRPFAARIARHRLRTQILCTSLANSIVDRVGPTLLMHSELAGIGAAPLARAYLIARDSAGLEQLWAQIEQLDGHMRAADQYRVLLAAGDYLRGLIDWLLAQPRRHRHVDATVRRLRPALHELARHLPAMLRGLDRERYLRLAAEHAAAGLPARLAERLAALVPLGDAPDLIELADRVRASPRRVAHLHFELGARLGLDWLQAAIEQLPADGAWQQAERARLRQACAAAHRRITAALLRHQARARLPRAATTAAPALQRWQGLLRDLQSAPAPQPAGLSVAIEALRNLAAGRPLTLARNLL